MASSIFGLINAVGIVLEVIFVSVECYYDLQCITCVLFCFCKKMASDSGPPNVRNLVEQYDSVSLLVCCQDIISDTIYASLF